MQNKQTPPLVSTRISANGSTSALRGLVRTRDCERKYSSPLKRFKHFKTKNTAESSKPGAKVNYGDKPVFFKVEGERSRGDFREEINLKPVFRIDSPLGNLHSYDWESSRFLCGRDLNILHFKLVLLNPKKLTIGWLHLFLDVDSTSTALRK